MHVQTASEGLLKIEEGSLYPALHRMERDKLISGSWKITDNGRRARFYALTTTGKKRLAEARENWKTVDSRHQEAHENIREALFGPGTKRSLMRIDGLVLQSFCPLNLQLAA